MSSTSGQKFRKALHAEKPLQIAGTINAYCALMAENVGFKSIYLSGAGVANCSYGLPDLGITTLDNVLEDAVRITAVVDLPLLVDIDTGWGNAFMISRTIKSMERAKVAAIHIEDQVFAKRCGHRAGKALVSKEEMSDRIKAAVDTREDPHFVIMARTDAFSLEGMDSTITRCLAYKEAGADMLFAEAFDTLEHYKILKEALEIPILANLTEFGRTPLFTAEDLTRVGIDMALYPLSACRAMNAAALNVYRDIRNNGTQKQSVAQMQTREELYGYLNYDIYEQKADHLVM